MRQKEKEENEQIELDNYSFKPLLTSERQSFVGGSVEQRTRDWKKMKNEKLNTMISMKKNKEMNECTFSPKIKASKYKNSRNIYSRSFYGKRKEGLDEVSYKNAMKGIHDELLSMSITNPNFN